MYIGPRASESTMSWMISAFAKFSNFQKFLLENEGSAAGMGIYLDHLGGAAKKAVSRLQTQKDLEHLSQKRKNMFRAPPITRVSHT